MFEGNAAEARTLVPTIQKVLKRYPIQRVVLVADRGLLSLDNLQSLKEITLDGRPLEFILAVPATLVFAGLLHLDKGRGFRIRDLEPPACLNRLPVLGVLAPVRL